MSDPDLANLDCAVETFLEFTYDGTTSDLRERPRGKGQCDGGDKSDGHERYAEVFHP
jgi:hypothetical protein